MAVGRRLCLRGRSGKWPLILTLFWLSLRHSDFLAHEVRNPLAAAISATSFVSSAVQAPNPLSTEDSKAAVLEDIGIINASLQYVNDLLRSMLDLHKTACDQLRVDLNPACLRKDVFDPIATMLYQREEHYRVQVDCPDTLMVVTDRIRLKQIVLNLANNSCKFVQKGYIRIGATVMGNNVRVFVEDSGPGIPMEKRDKLFDKFQSSLDSLSQGTGIGLCLCKDLTQLMGGTIALDESFHSGVEGCRGTRFIIDLNTEPLELPAQDVGEGSTTDTMSDSETPELPSKFRVLFADDDLVLRKLFKRSILRVAPEWDVEEAANGETAVRMIQEASEPFDLIFCK